MPNHLYSIVVPVYNSVSSLYELYERIKAVFSNTGHDFELIMVEDGGRKESWQVMQSLRRKDSRVKIIRLMRNFGQHNALLCGFSFAGGAFVITMDDDLQNPPEEIPKLIKTINETGLDVICGVARKKKHSPLRLLGSRFYHFLIARIFIGIPDFGISNFRIITKGVIDNLLRLPTPNPLIGLLILRITDRIGTVEIRHNPRHEGKSNYGPGKLLGLVFDGILYHSTLPLKGVFYLGICSSLLATILGVFYLSRYLFGQINVSGFTTIVLLILFFFGILLFAVGIIGEYLLRIIQEVSHTPSFVVRDKDV